MTDYDDLSLRCSLCTRCALSHTRRNVVVDRGNPASPLVFIGEAPGAEEDRSGEAFVGPSGKRLDKLCELAGLVLDDSLMLNVLKCRPPGNRFPKKDDLVEECIPWLEEQLDTLRPALVVLVGKKALDWVIQRHLGIDDPVGKYVGKVLLLRAVYPYVLRFYVMYHPSYLLRKRSKSLDQRMVNLLERTSKDLDDLRAGRELEFLGDAIEFRKKVEPPSHHQFDLFEGWKG